MKAKQLFVQQSIESSFSVRQDWQSNVNNRWHYHKEVELICFHKGTGMQFVGDSIKRFVAGDVVMVGTNLPHYWRYDDGLADESARLPFSTVVHFQADFLGEKFMQLPESKGIAWLIERSKRGLAFRGKQADRAIRQLSALSQNEGIYRLAALLQCLEGLAAVKEASFLSSLGFRYHPNSLGADRINKVYAYSFRHFDKPIKLEEVAGMVSLSRASFCRFFKGYTGKSYSRFLCELRIGHACRQLLEYPDYPIKQICYASGFRNFTSFHEAFKAITGMTPRAYQAYHGVAGAAV